MSDAMSEVFGPNPRCPDHPDHWRLSEILLGYDGGMDEALSDDAKNAFWEKSVDDVIDRYSLIYTCFQRALRVQGVTTREEIVANFAILAKLTTVYAEAFLVGVQFQKRGGKQ